MPAPDLRKAALLSIALSALSPVVLAQGADGFVQAIEKDREAATSKVEALAIEAPDRFKPEGQRLYENFRQSYNKLTDTLPNADKVAPAQVAQMITDMHNKSVQFVTFVENAQGSKAASKTLSAEELVKRFNSAHLSASDKSNLKSLKVESYSSVAQSLGVKP